MAHDRHDIQPLPHDTAKKANCPVRTQAWRRPAICGAAPRTAWNRPQEAAEPNGTERFNPRAPRSSTNLDPATQLVAGMSNCAPE